MKELIVGIVLGAFIYYLAYFIATKVHFKTLKKDLENKYELSERMLEMHYDDLEKEKNEIIDKLVQNIETKETKISTLEEQEIKISNSIEEQQERSKQEEVKFNKELEKWNNEIKTAQLELDEVNKRIDSALETEKKIAELKRQEQEEKASVDYYKLNISSTALNDIKILRSIENFISNKSELNKVIWKLGYEKPYKELCSKILKPNNDCGIYKITNLDNDKVYIGQSVRLSERIKEHIKSGIGVDTKDTLLYREMRTTDLTNFTFEIVEYCTKEELNEKEKFWINYYSSNVYGYNMNIGGSKNQ